MGPGLVWGGWLMFAAFASSPTLPRSAAPVVAGSVSGTVTNSVGGAPVAGGTIQLIRSGTVVDTEIPDGSGNYTFASVQAGDVVKNQPKGAFCIADAGEFTVNPGDTQDFEVQAAYWFDDFQSYDADADFATIGSGGTNGCFFDNNISGGSAGGHDGNINGVVGGFTITLGTNGPSGSKTMMYTWDARPTCPPPNFACDECAKSLGMYPRFNVLGAFGDEIWLTFYEKPSSDFVVGSDDCFGSSREMKFIIVDMVTTTSEGPPPVYGSSQQAWLEFEDPSVNPASPTNIKLRLKMTTNAGGTLSGISASDAALGSDFPGNFHRWTIGITGIQDTTQTLAVYYDDALLNSCTNTIPWMSGNNYQSANAIIAIQMGANINNGPTAGGMTRSFREFGLYPARPTTIAGLAV